MNQKPDTELFELLARFQKGDSHAGWLFADHKKIKQIIRGRLRQYRQMFHWLPVEDLEDVACGLLPRIIDIAGQFDLPDQANDGKIIAYFALRIRGEADFLLKKITNMKQVVDEKSGKTYFKSLSQPIDGLEEVLPSDVQVDHDVVESIEFSRIDSVLIQSLEKINPESNDRIWLRCYLLRLRDLTWAQIAKDIGYRQTDYAWLKENTARFVSRLKHRLIFMGEDVNYRICGIYTDDSEVAICVLDSADRKKNLIWSKDYESYADLDKVEAKLGDIFRQYDITYVMMNDIAFENRAFVIVMRYLSKRESFVETVDLGLFKNLLPLMPSSVNGISSTDSHRQALLLAHVKKAIIDESVRKQPVSD